MPRIPIALQLYSVRKDCERDLPGTLKAVAEMGYDGVEFAGYHGRSADELRKMLDDLGLRAAGSHLALQHLQGDELDRTIEFNKTIGSKFPIIAGVDREYLETRDAAASFGRTLGEIAEKLAPHGMQTGYHNHRAEFKPINGETAWDLIAANSRPDVVMQLDLGNAMAGGADIAAVMKKWAARGFTVHLKERSSAKDDAIVGEGDVPWQEIFSICEAAGNTEWYIVEQESYAYPPLECVARCLTNLREMGK
ncbi:MAG: sugar phosphate isomerase/epimerase [Armatimonadota bacterium]|nr:MAG: sugar phosphate isomerase/epimerase [Armatimonadota bacterium]